MLNKYFTCIRNPKKLKSSNVTITFFTIINHLLQYPCMHLSKIATRIYKECISSKAKFDKISKSKYSESHELWIKDQINSNFSWRNYPNFLRTLFFCRKWISLVPTMNYFSLLIIFWSTLWSNRTEDFLNTLMLILPKFHRI